MSPTALDQRTRLLALATLAVLVVASTWTMLGNQWVQDDLPIIVTNELMHSLDRPWKFFLTSYWPEPYPRELYRPLASLLYATEWAIGGGAPVAFRLGSITLYLLATIACWGLARRLLPSWGAWVAAALFAVHPVHVEAVAVGVNQAELVVAILLLLGTSKWLDRRRAGQPVTGWWGAGILALWCVALLFKEHAMVFPVLLAGAEATILRDGVTPPLPRAAWRRMVVVVALVLVVTIAVRDLVLQGDTKGSFTAEALVGLSVGGRLFTMLGVVPEWLRLLVWPAHLRADYSPQEIMPATDFGMAQGIGLFLLVVAVALLIWTWRRQPAVAFGVFWLGVALGPVHNVLVPTGIVLAERTLFLGSAGFLIGAVALVAWRRSFRPSRSVDVLLAGSVAVLLVCGVTRSASRQRVWRDLATLWHQTLIDAPLSYRAHHAYAQVLYGVNAKGTAERYYRRAMELYSGAWPVHLDLADKYRLAGDCWPAIELYRVLLRINPPHTAGRGSLIACLLYVGEYAEAAEMARIGIEQGRQTGYFRAYLATADSAAAVQAPAGTVRLPPPTSSDSLR